MATWIAITIDAPPIHCKKGVPNVIKLSSSPNQLKKCDEKKRNTTVRIIPKIAASTNPVVITCSISFPRFAPNNCDTKICKPTETNP